MTLTMDLFKKLRKGADTPSAPPTPKTPMIRRIELPESSSPVHPLKFDVVMDDEASTSSDDTPSPVSPMVRRRLGSLLGRSSTPKSSSRPSTPASQPQRTSTPPLLVAPTPKWKMAPSVREQGWKNVPATPDYAKERRRRTASLQAPVPRPATAAVSEWSIESSEKLKTKHRSKSPHAPSPVPLSRRAETPDLKKQAQASAALPLRRSSSTRPTEPRPIREVNGAKYSYGMQGPHPARSASRSTAASSASGSSASSAKRPVKGILKTTKPTPVNTAALLAPSPSGSPVPLPAARGAVPLRPPSDFMLHWQLLCPNPSTGKWIRFDIAVPPTLVRRYGNGCPYAIGEQDRSKNATAGLQLTQMTIRCPALPHWTVAVANTAGITCGDVFDAIHKTFTVPLSAAEQTQYVTDQNRSAVEQAFKQRCKDVPGLDAWHRKQGLLRVDLLLGKRLFAGLSLAGEDRCDLWEMLTMSET
jgi:hypothetical protein